MTETIGFALEKGELVFISSRECPNLYAKGEGRREGEMERCRKGEKEREEGGDVIARLGDAASGRCLGLVSFLYSSFFSSFFLFLFLFVFISMDGWKDFLC